MYCILFYLVAAVVTMAFGAFCNYGLVGGPAYGARIGLLSSAIAIGSGLLIVMLINLSEKMIQECEHKKAEK